VFSDKQIPTDMYTIVSFEPCQVITNVDYIHVTINDKTALKMNVLVNYV